MQCLFRANILSDFRGTPFSRLKQSLSSLSKKEKGSSLVEMALTLPVMLMIVTGICTFGIAMNQYSLLTDATNAGARQLSILRGQATDPCATVSASVKSATPLLTSTNLSYTYTINGSTYTGTSCTSAASVLNSAQGTTATLRVTYPCVLKIYGSNLVPSCVRTAQTSAIVQ